jgi:uncharacterized membrane protein YphA (DoxX/SURF4 family)
MANVAHHGEHRAAASIEQVAAPLAGIGVLALAAAALSDAAYTDWLQLAGRTLFVAIFVMSGIAHLAKYDEMVAYARQSGAPLPELTVPLTGLMIMAGGVMLLLGAWMDLGALLIALFLLPTAFYMHAFWTIDDPMVRAVQQAHFMKNVALAGAALIAMYLAVTNGSALDYVLGPVSLFNEINWTNML